MGILNMIKKVEAEQKKLETHPAQTLDLEGKLHYLRGLALMMNVDDEIHDKELNYLKVLMRTFDLPSDMLEDLIAFAKKPAETAIPEMIASIVENSMREPFMLDCLVMAHCDERFDPNEKELLTVYENLLKLPDRTRTDLRAVHDLIRKRETEQVNYWHIRIDKKWYEHLLPFFEIKIEWVQPHYIDNGDGTVTSLDTELMWQQEDDGKKREWEKLIDYATHLNYLKFAGYEDWRVPTIKELQTLIVKGKESPFIDTTYFPSVKTDSFYWSSSSNADNTSDAWGVDFNDGNVLYYFLKTGSYYVRCVRGGQ
ncbi:MAG: DUF1566 domain-containing protein [SAR324 cluster bacterium]|nr:DUF1566 domain-containing protein [SAR324 cluster bacterium]